jgi:hypothetical protein
MGEACSTRSVGVWAYHGSRLWGSSTWGQRTPHFLRHAVGGFWLPLLWDMCTHWDLGCAQGYSCRHSWEDGAHNMHREFMGNTCTHGNMGCILTQVCTFRHMWTSIWHIVVFPSSPFSPFQNVILPFHFVKKNSGLLQLLLIQTSSFPSLHNSCCGLAGHVWSVPRWNLALGDDEAPPCG